jgi:DNA-binding XRE family transcriptional regulator
MLGRVDKEEREAHTQSIDSMAKDGRGTSFRTAQTRPDRNVRSSPVLVPSVLAEEHRRDKNRAAPNAELCAAGEKSQLEFQKIFGINLKAARLKSNLKQSEVAAMTGLTQQYLSLIEAGQQNVTIKTMAVLAKVVDHDLLDLLKHALGMPSKEG